MSHHAFEAVLIVIGICVILFLGVILGFGMGWSATGKAIERGWFDHNGAIYRVIPAEVK